MSESSDSIKKNEMDLSGYHVLNLNKDSRLDSLVQKISQFLEVKDVSASFVQGKTIWYKSHSHLGPFCLPKDQGVCPVVVESNEILILEDATQDETYQKHPAVTGQENLRFYIGVPIQNNLGDAMGALCAYGSSPRSISKKDIEFLKLMAGQIFQLLESQKSCLTSECKEVNRRSDKTDLEVLHYCSDLGVWKWNLETNDVEFDERWCEIIGYNRSDVGQHFSTFEELIHPEDMDRVMAAVSDYLEGRTERYEVFFKLKHKNGHWVPILSKGKVFETLEGKPVLFCGTHFDMTYMKKVEENAENIQALSDEIQRMGQIGAWEMSIADNELLWTDETYRIHGLEPGTQVDINSAIDYYQAHERGRIKTYIEDCINKKKSYIDDFEFEDAQGEKKWVRAYGEPICDNENHVVKLMGTFQDISYQKELELSLRKRNADLKAKEEELEMMIQSTYDGIWDWHIKDDYEYMSPRFWEILGFAPHEKSHHPSEWEKLIFSEDLPILNERYDRYVKSKGEEPFFQEIRFHHKDGSTVWVLCRGQVVEWDENDNPIRMIGAHTDITELKQAQINLQESAKLIALGEMAGGVAHEINNPLAIINSSAEALSRVLKKNNFDHPMGIKFIGNIQHTVNRISKIVDGLKKISRHGEHDDVEVCYVHDIIMDSLSLSSEKFKTHGVELSIELYENFEVMCRPIELSQVIINILNNAYHAVKKQVDACVILRVLEKDKETITIEIEDNGPGVPGHLVDKIMEPFFTTKPVGEGTGLGLSISREIIEAMDGKLSLGDSEKGACFHINLKRAESGAKRNYVA